MRLKQRQRALDPSFSACGAHFRPSRRDRWLVGQRPEFRFACASARSAVGSAFTITNRKNEHNSYSMSDLAKLSPTDNHIGAEICAVSPLWATWPHKSLNCAQNESIPIRELAISHPGAHDASCSRSGCRPSTASPSSESRENDDFPVHPQAVV